MRMVFPIWAVIWDVTKCDIKHCHDVYFRRDDIMEEIVAGTFFAKKVGQRQLLLSSQGVGLRRNKSWWARERQTNTFVILRMMRFSWSGARLTKDGCS